MATSFGEIFTPTKPKKAYHFCLAVHLQIFQLKVLQGLHGGCNGTWLLSVQHLDSSRYRFACTSGHRATRIHELIALPQHPVHADSRHA